MKPNIGTLDKGLRIVAALVILALYYMEVISGTTGIVLLVISGSLILTSFISFCPLYYFLGINTGKKEK